MKHRRGWLIRCMRHERSKESVAPKAEWRLIADENCKILFGMSYRSYLNSDEWKRMMRSVIAEHPYCAVCSRPSQVVHHTEHSARTMAGLRSSTMVALCAGCSNRILKPGGKAFTLLHQANQDLLDAIAGAGRVGLAISFARQIEHAEKEELASRKKEEKKDQEFIAKTTRRKKVKRPDQAKINDIKRKQQQKPKPELQHKPKYEVDDEST